MVGYDLFKIDLRRSLGLLPILVDIGVFQDFKQPCFGISSFPVLVDKTIGLEVGFLYQIVGVVLVVRQVIGKGLQGIDVG
jgi:hypothetical protein